MVHLREMPTDLTRKQMLQDDPRAADLQEEGGDLERNHQKSVRIGNWLNRMREVNPSAKTHL